MPEELLQLNVFRPSIFDFAANLLVALGCGLIIALVYRFTQRGASYSPSFVNALVLLSLITAIVILVIGNNLARAFGLVGAMSIVRFRTAVRDVQDIVFIFFSLTTGMAAGVDLNSIAIISTLFVCLTIILLDVVRVGSPVQLRHLLHVSHIGSPAAETALQQVLKKHARRIRLVNVRKLPGQEEMETIYNLALRNVKKKKQAEFIHELRELEYVSGAKLFFEEEAGAHTIEKVQRND